VAFACAARKPFAVVPCCVYSHEFPHRALFDPSPSQAGAEGRGADGGGAKAPHGGTANPRPVRTYEDLVKWCLLNGPPGTQKATLDFEGKNVVVFWTGEGNSGQRTTGDHEAGAVTGT